MSTSSPANSPALQEATMLFLQGKLARAEAVARDIVRAQADCFEALRLLGVIAIRNGRFGEALEWLREAVEANPDDVSTHCHRGLAFLSLGYGQEALASYDRALEIDPECFDALCGRGHMLHRLRHPDLALASYDRALQLRPDAADIFNRRGTVLHDLGRFDDAIASYDAALKLMPNHADAFGNRGLSLHLLGRLDDAVDSYTRGLAINPRCATSFNNRGVALFALRRYDEAIYSYDRALAVRYDYDEALTNRGMALRKLNRLDEALACHERALRLKPDNFKAWDNLGLVLRSMNRLEEALRCHDRACQIRPNHAVAHLNGSFCRLQLGDFEAGWQQYEWRWQTPQLAHARRDFKAPMWTGREAVRGKAVLLHAEQGLGDTIQFVRFAKQIAAGGATVLLEAPAPLLPLLKNVPGVSDVVEAGAPLPAFDFHCPLMSLPLALGTRMHTIPAAPAYLAADPDRIDVWRARLGDAKTPRIGIVWAGDSLLLDDMNRSVPLTAWTQVLDHEAAFFCLQKEVCPEDMELLRARGIAQFGDQLSDFGETAALIAQMDLVITVDTSVAHLAGALGKPVWILLPFSCDWRWMTGRSDSPWYPSATLFRQPATGDWAGVMSAVAARLAAAA